MPVPHWLRNLSIPARRWFDQLSGTSRIGVPALVLAILIAAVDFLTHLKDARELITAAITLGLKIEPGNAKVEIRSWFFLAVSLWIFISALFFVLWIQAELRQRDDHAVRTLRGVMRAAGHICRRMFPQNHVSDLTTEKIHFVYQIDKDFTTHVRRTFKIRAGLQPVYFIERKFRVRDHADPADSLIDIDFQVRDIGDPEGVVYLPMVNEQKSKSACIFFLPRIEPGEARTVEVSYKWPGMVRALREEGEEEFTIRQASGSDIAEFCMELYLEPGSGGTLFWEESGRPIPNKVIQESKSQQDWPGVKYSASNVPSAVVNGGIGLRLRWKST